MNCSKILNPITNQWIEFPDHFRRVHWMIIHSANLSPRPSVRCQTSSGLPSDDLSSTGLLWGDWPRTTWSRRWWKVATVQPALFFPSKGIRGTGGCYKDLGALTWKMQDVETVEKIEHSFQVFMLQHGRPVPARGLQWNQCPHLRPCDKDLLGERIYEYHWVPSITPFLLAQDAVWGSIL